MKAWNVILVTRDDVTYEEMVIQLKEDEWGVLDIKELEKEE